MRERIATAVAKATEIIRLASGPVVELSPTETDVLKRLLALGVVTMNRPKIRLQRDIYFPCIEAEEFEGLSAVAYLRILRYVMNKEGVKSGLSINSVRDYIYTYWEYNIEPKVISKDEAGSKQVAAEEEALRIIMENEDGK